MYKQVPSRDTVFEVTGGIAGGKIPGNTDLPVPPQLRPLQGCLLMSMATTRAPSVPILHGSVETSSLLLEQWPPLGPRDPASQRHLT